MRVEIEERPPLLRQFCRKHEAVTSYIGLDLREALTNKTLSGRRHSQDTVGLKSSGAQPTTKDGKPERTA
ncbi:hypothetical protein COCOBI_19-1730 [Coccomyxa sp. Obi]|nr:hypothetical protein COCOBI_19-1730 [Coccomyxa sp. Obi]